MSQKTEIEALRAEVAALREEIAQLRRQAVYHNPMTPMVAPPYPLGPTYPGGPWPTIAVVGGEIAHYTQDTKGNWVRV